MAQGPSVPPARWILSFHRRTLDGPRVRSHTGPANRVATTPSFATRIAGDHEAERNSMSDRLATFLSAPSFGRRRFLAGLAGAPALLFAVPSVADNFVPA